MSLNLVDENIIPKTPYIQHQTLFETEILLKRLQQITIISGLST